MSAVDNHVTNVTNFIRLFLKGQGCLDVYQGFFQGLMNAVRDAHLQYPNVEVFLINKFVIDTLVQAGVPIELEIEWSSEYTQQDLAKVVSIKGSRVYAIRVPKRSRTLYEFFCQETRQEIVDLVGTKSPAVVNKELAKRWYLTNQTPYKALAENDKVRFQAKKDRYNVC